MQNVQKILIFFISSIILFSCSRDQVSEVSCESLQSDPTYNSEIIGIMNSSCAYSGCHVEGFQWGDFSTYDKMESYFGDDFINRIVTDNMPPPDVFDTLSPLKKLQLQCWHQNQYPEN